MDPRVVSLPSVVGQLDAWQASASSAAQTSGARRAVQWIHAASVAISLADQLRLQLADVLDEIASLEPKCSDSETATVADQVRAMARREGVVDRVAECAGVLRIVWEERASWFAAVIAHLPGPQQQRDAEDLLWCLASHSEALLMWVGAREKGPTPTGITDVESALRSADDEAIARATALARNALTVIDVYRLREARNLLGELLARAASTYDLPPPPTIEP